ncbi:hypothetical protein [Kordia periserrulae]|nr:hypothetical protein [Kordia periserrulae]
MDSQSEKTTSSQPQNNSKKANINTIATEEYFDKRYQKDTMDATVLDGTLKMIEGYFVANKLKPAITNPINHPKNLDLTINEGFGFDMYCKALDMDENYAVGLLAMAFNDFMIKQHGFKLYKDTEPEYPLRDMTLKYDNQGAKLSLYPIEYTVKVLNYEANFNDLYERIKYNLDNMPTSAEVYHKLTKKK